MNTPARKPGELICLSPADARRMEACEEYGAIVFARAMQAKSPASGAAIEPIAGGHMIFTTPGSPIGRAHSLGFSGPVTPDVLEQVERFYHSRGVPAQVDVCPYADTSLMQLVAERGYHVVEFNNVLARRILREEPFAPPKGIELRRVTAATAELWSRTVSEGFANFPTHDAPPLEAEKPADSSQPSLEEIFRVYAVMEGTMTYLAYVDGKPAGGATGLIIPEHNVAGFFGASTLPQFRGRGVQTALFHRRLADAQTAGCDLAVTFTLPGTTSQRNAERAGFRTAYTKAVVMKKPG